MTRNTLVTIAVILTTIAMFAGIGTLAGCSYDRDKAERDIGIVNTAAQAALDKLDKLAESAEEEVALAKSLLDEFASSGVAEELLPENAQRLIAQARAVIEQYPAFVASLPEAKAKIQADADARIASINESSNWYESALNVVGFAGMVVMTFLGVPVALRAGRNNGVINGVAKTASLIAAGRAVDPNFDAAFKSETPAVTAMKALLAQMPDTVRTTIRTENKSAKAAA